MADIALTPIQQFWLEHVKACEAAGVSMKSYAEERGLKLQSFYCWKGQLKKRGVLGEGRPRSLTASLVPVDVTPRPEPALALTRITLASGIVIEAPSSLGADALCDLLRAAMAAGRPAQ
jgi:hypothetical protein